MSSNYTTSVPPRIPPSSNTVTSYVEVLQVESMLVDSLSAKSTTGSAVAGIATLSGGTVTVATTAVLTGDIILVTVNTKGAGDMGVKLCVSTIVNATSFTITSTSVAGVTTGTDTSTINWMIVHPVIT